MSALSSLQETIRNTSDYVNVTFESLIQRQQLSSRGASLRQLGVLGVGYGVDLYEYCNVSLQCLLEMLNIYRHLFL